jgi:hypothetical protein
MSAERTGIIKKEKRDSESEYSELRRNENACVPELLMEFLKCNLFFCSCFKSLCDKT